MGVTKEGRALLPLTFLCPSHMTCQADTSCFYFLMSCRTWLLQRASQERESQSRVSEDPGGPHTQVAVCPTWAEISLHHSIRNSPGDDCVQADRSLQEKPGPVLPSEALPGARPTQPPSPQGLALASNQRERSLPRTGQETVPRIPGPCFSPAFCPAGCDGLTCPLEADGIRQGQIAHGGG